jgi:ribonuclease P protein component
MAKILIFKKRKDFLRVAAQFYVATHNMVLQAAHSLSETDDIWVGYTSTKKIGNAVCRNKSRRRLRAVVREVLKDYAYPHVDYVFIARQSTATCDFAELKKDTIYAIKKINKNFLLEADSHTSQCNSDENA